MDKALHNLRNFSDITRALDRIQTRHALMTLNDEVETLFASDRPLLVMTDAEWVEYTRLIACKAEFIDRNASESQRGEWESC